MQDGSDCLIWHLYGAVFIVVLFLKETTIQLWNLPNHFTQEATAIDLADAHVILSAEAVEEQLVKALIVEAHLPAAAFFVIGPQSIKVILILDAAKLEPSLLLNKGDEHEAV